MFYIIDTNWKWKQAFLWSPGLPNTLCKLVSISQTLSDANSLKKISVTSYFNLNIIVVCKCLGPSGLQTITWTNADLFLWSSGNRLVPSCVVEVYILPVLVIWLWNHFDGLVEERRNSSALAVELRLSCTNPSICELCIFRKCNVLLFREHPLPLLSGRLLETREYFVPWKSFPYYWHTVRGTTGHRSHFKAPKMLWCFLWSCLTNSRVASYLRRHGAGMTSPWGYTVQCTPKWCARYMVCVYFIEKKYLTNFSSLPSRQFHWHRDNHIWYDCSSWFVRVVVVVVVVEGGGVSLRVMEKKSPCHSWVTFKQCRALTKLDSSYIFLLDWLHINPLAPWRYGNNFDWSVIS